MNILFIKLFFVGFMVSEIPIVSVFGYFPLYNFQNVYNILIMLITLCYIFIFQNIINCFDSIDSYYKL